MDDQLDDNTLEAHQEWAGEAYEHLTNIFNRVASMLNRDIIKQEDAAFLLKEASEAQGWLENILQPDKESKEQANPFYPIFTVNALPSILWYNLEMAHEHMKMFKRDQPYYTAKIDHICDVLMQQNYNA